MVPAAVFHQKKKRNPSVKTKPGAKQGGYGLIPTSEKKKDINEPSSSKRDLPTKEDDTYSTFLKSMRELGAL